VVAFDVLRPVELNTTEFWNARFAQGFNTPLTILTTLGLLGLAAWLFLVVKTATSLQSTDSNNLPIWAAIALTLGLQLLFPSNTVLLVVQMMAIVFWIANQQKKYPSLELHPLQVKITSAGKEGPERKVSQYSKTFSYLVSAVLIICIGITGLGLSKVYAAHYLVFAANKAAIKKDIIGVYNLQKQAVTLNRYSDSLRRSYALTNLAIANAMAQKEEKAPEDGEQIGQLLQQAIREGKAATLIDPSNSQNWQVLGQIYAGLVGATEGAENWSVSAYAKAIETNSTSPLLRIKLGSVFLSLGEYQQAITLFEQAARLKPDYTNAHYNLANAFAEAGKADEARRFYEISLSQLDSSSADYQKVKQELDQLDTRVAEALKKRQAEQAKQTTQPSEASQVNLLEENLGEASQNIEPDSQVELKSAPTETTANPIEVVQ